MTLKGSTSIILAAFRYFLEFCCTTSRVVLRLKGGRLLPFTGGAASVAASATTSFVAARVSGRAKNTSNHVNTMLSREHVSDQYRDPDLPP